MKKATHQTPRRELQDFQQIRNIGPSIAADFHRLGIESPSGLIGQDPVSLYRQVCEVDQVFHDPCVLDCFMAAVDYMNGNPPQDWWAYTEIRKRDFHQDVDELRGQYPRPEVNRSS